MSTKPAAPIEGHLILPNAGYDNVYAIPHSIAHLVLANLKVLQKEWKDSQSHYTLVPGKTKEIELHTLDAEQMTAAIVAGRLKRKEPEA